MEILRNFLQTARHNPTILIGLLCLVFWLADTYLKLFVLNAPSRMLWYSSAGLFVTTVALFTKNSFLLSSMFCVLLVNEALWSISFLSFILFNRDLVGMTKYMFSPTLPVEQFIISLYHLILVPASIIGLIAVRKVSNWGWLGALIFVTTINTLAFHFPDPTENINCIKGPTLFSCKLFFDILYNIYGTYLSDQSRIWLILMASTALTIFVYLPINLFLILLARVLVWLNRN